MKTFLFPGQGSQSKGMGKDLFDEFKELTAKADEILGYSIRELCVDNPKKELNQTQFTQPALFVVNALFYLKKVEESGKPDYVSGHSLGEFNALLAAECFDFETGLKLVKRRGELMGEATGGGMAAISNASREQIESILKENGLTNIELANFNTPSQVVISGLRDEVGKAQPFFQKDGMRYNALNTSGAFHSKYMQPSKEKFEAYLKEFKFSDLKIPVISNVTARPYEADAVIKNLSDQMTSSVRWSESIQYLMGLGDMEFEEIRAKVLTKIVKQIKEETSKSQTDAVQEQVAVETPPVEKLEPAPQANDGTNGKKSLTAEEKVNTWNQSHPIGTKVKSEIVEDEGLETRTEAVVLFGHRAAVYLKGFNGYFDLDELVAL